MSSLLLHAPIICTSTLSLSLSLRHTYYHFANLKTSLKLSFLSAKMGNQFALCICTRFSCIEATFIKHQKVLRVVKTDGKIMEFRAPILVKDLLLSFPSLGVALSKESSQHLPLNYELKVGKVCYLLPSTSSAETNVSHGGVSSNDAEAAGGIKRIKVIITKQQLQELLSKRISVQEMLAGIEKKSCSSSPIVSSSTSWKPKLDSIPEGSD